MNPLIRSLRLFAFPVAALLSAAPARAQVVISEFVTNVQNETTGLRDEDGEHNDWLELQNTGATAVSLNGWYLTDSSADLTAWQFPVSAPVVSLAPNARLVIWASGKNRKANAAKLHTNFKLQTEAGGFLALVRPDSTIEYAYTAYPQQIQDVPYGIPTVAQLQPLIVQGASGKANVPTSAADFSANYAGWNTPTFNDAGWQAGQSGFGYDTTGSYGPLIGTGGDLKALMYNLNPSAFIRFTFNIADKSQVLALRLQMKYDDGFIAYVNGTVIAQSFAPGSPQWNSSAIVDRAGALTGNFEVYNPATAQNSLVNGTNVLAIQLLNFTNGSTEDTDDQFLPNGSRALALPILEGNIASGAGTPTYLVKATPGTTNDAARSNIGPLISGTTDQAPRPTGAADSPPITITSRVTPSLRPLATINPVLLKYLVRFNAEVTVPMVDDGTGGDAVANDGIYTAQIPVGQLPAAALPPSGGPLLPGEMLRWRVVATDNANISSTEPPFLDTLDNDRYFGTVARETQTASSLLPVMHWFVSDANASRTTGGTRCSLFYLDRFYDNVLVNLHGQSSSGFPTNKKSHNFNFSQDNRFKWREGEDRIRGINLLTNYSDKSKVRNTIAWEMWANAGHRASHWCFPIRVQQNAAFWGIYDLNENGDEDFLKRAGLDPNGILYKLYDRMVNPSTAEKKNGFPETDRADLSALYTNLEYETANGRAVVPILQRRTYGYDNVDIPSLVNFLAVNAFINNNDQGHKNFYLYHDTYGGTPEWSMLPWDEDLAIGHTWQSAPNYFDDEIDSQRPLRNGAVNELKQLCYDSPEINAMFVRRVRTLMDTFLISATATDGPIEQRLNQLLNLMDPHDDDVTTGLDDADLDMRKWGYWVQGSGNPLFSGSGGMAAHTARLQTARILNANPNDNTINYNPYPGLTSSPFQGNNTRPAFLPGRRTFLFSSPFSGSLQVPVPQAAVPTGLTIEQIDFNPASGNGDHEFFIIKNTNSFAVDVSGWKVSGPGGATEGHVDYIFWGGTVIPAGGGASDNIGLLHVARNPKAFRQRTASPKGAERRLVVGGYDGRLTARGDTIELRNAAGAMVTSSTYAAAPTEAQTSLRVSEINFAPSAPTAAELAALPGVQAGDFEFVELINNGATPLNLANAQFDKGITFAFPATFTLAPGARTLVVANAAAFALRYGATPPPGGFNIAGQFEGNLDNAGELLRLLDSVGEEVLRFTYDPAWYPPAAGAGYSLVTRTSAPAYDAYNTPTTWALSGQSAGSPGTGDTSFSQAFEGWRYDFFSTTEQQNVLIGAATADPDNDGEDNLAEYAYGRNPRVNDGPVTTDTSFVDVGGVKYLAITFTRRQNAADLTYIVEVSSDLASWVAVNLPVGAPQDLGGGLERVTYRDNQPATSAQRFVHVRAVK